MNVQQTHFWISIFIPEYIYLWKKKQRYEGYICKNRENRFEFRENIFSHVRRTSKFEKQIDSLFELKRNAT